MKQVHKIEIHSPRGELQYTAVVDLGHEETRNGYYVVWPDTKLPWLSIKPIKSEEDETGTPESNG